MFVNAYVNDGRWVVNCPNCNGAEIVSRATPQFVCRPQYSGCGLVADVRFPADYDAIMAVLAVRPTRNQHWLPGETVADLRIENALHQLPSGVTP